MSAHRGVHTIVVEPPRSHNHRVHIIFEVSPHRSSPLEFTLPVHEGAAPALL